MKTQFTRAEVLNLISSLRILEDRAISDRFTSSSSATDYNYYLGKYVGFDIVISKLSEFFEL